jgi:hypothetical protein
MRRDTLAPALWTVALMTTLAAETHEAELSSELNGWLRARLSPAERDRAEEARRAELDALAATLDASPHETLARAIGLPVPSILASGYFNQSTAARQI